MKKTFLSLVLFAVTLTALASLKYLVTVSKAVTTAGVPIRISATNDYFVSVYIQNRATNAGSIYLMSSSNTAQRVVLAPGQGFPIGIQRDGDFISLYDLWIDSSVSGEIADCIGVRR